MGKEAKQLKELFHDIIEYVRINHTEAIDKAYSYFWDGETPDEFLSGNSLMLGFHNFEDWMVFDHKINEEGDTYIDLFIKDTKDLDEHAVSLLRRAKDSVMSLYEVTSVAKDKRVFIKDILFDREAELREKALTQGLKKGDLFATRLFKLDNIDVMSACVYPYNPGQKKKVLAYVDKQFKRYVRNVKKDGDMQDYLKNYGDVFNLIWMNFIIAPPEKEA
ncbi:MAG: hypothetical protein Q8K68_12205 [Nitrospirota bacterium]|nr:hypothetical protein [Nitrospirota bacterium]